MLQNNEINQNKTKATEKIWFCLDVLKMDSEEPILLSVSVVDDYDSSVAGVRCNWIYLPLITLPR